jgi:hypothetical protein
VRQSGSAAPPEIVRKRCDLAGFGLLLFERLDAFLQEHIKVPCGREPFGEPFQFALYVLRIRLFDKILEQRHRRTKPPEAHAHLVHTFRIALGHGILVCGEVVQARKADDLKSLACSHAATQNDVVLKNRPRVFTSTERVTALSLSFVAVGCVCFGRNPARKPDRLDRLPVLDLNLDFADWFASSARSDLAAIDRQ